MKRFVFFCFSFSLISALFNAPARADRVYLSDGRVIEGVAEDEGSQVKITIANGSAWYPKSKVLKIEYTGLPENEYAEKSAALKENDVNGRLELAVWCRKNGLKEEWKAEVFNVLKLDPDNEKAHKEFGEVFYNNAWVPVNEANLAKGLTEYEGDWITAEEKSLREALHEKEQLKKELDKKIQALIRLLGSNLPEERADAKAKLLSISGEDKIGTYLKSLQSKNEDIKRFILDEILANPSRETVPALVQTAITDPNEIFRNTSLEGLKSMKNQAGLIGKTAASYLSGKDASLRMRAEQMLTVFPHKPAVPALISLLEYTFTLKGSEITYYETGPNGPISAVGIKTGEENLDDATKKQLEEQRSQERKTVLEALKKITGVNFGIDTDRWRNWYSFTESITKDEK
ncbi:MAG: hypothetical protein HZA48_07230 [Planctomycetes bacterium]|nr:hypothetical protein [Planctomycetota bacterium]